MPNHFASSAKREVVYNAAEGNLSCHVVQRDLDSVLDADTVDFFRLPVGCELIDAYVVTDGGGAATSIMLLGLKGVNGASQDDPDYFHAGVALDAAALTRKNTATAPVTLTDETIIQGTIDTANVGAGACLVTVAVLYRSKGNK